MVDKVRLGEFIDLKTGNPFKSVQFTDSLDGVRLLRGDNVGQGRLRWAGAKRWPSTDLASLDDFELEEGDVVLAMDRPWVTAGLKYAEVRQEDIPSLLVQRVARLRANGGLEQRFLKYVIGSPSFTSYVLGVQTGTSIPHISPEQIRNFTFSMPSPTEQSAISAILGVLDDKIAVNEHISETALALARAVYRQAVRRNERDAKLGELVVLKYGKALREPDRRSGQVPVFGCTGQVGWHDSALTSDAGPVVGRKGANAGWVSWAPRSSWVIDTAFFVHIVRECLSPEVAFLMLETANLSGFVGDSAVPGLNRDAAHSQLVRVPSEEVASELSERVAPLMLRSTQSQYESRTLAALRDTLIPQLMSGKLRVRDAEKIVEDAL
ncbi:restriction endonuclease subunit S [Streptomyces sp. NPDC054765]